MSQDIVKQIRIATTLALLLTGFIAFPGSCAYLFARENTVKFAVIGDYGVDRPRAKKIAELVRGWNVDLILTVGDNSYPDGNSEIIDERIGRYYHQFIGNYRGKYGSGSTTNRFFPTLGNHDWKTAAEGLPKPYLDYFTLPGNERYYRFTWGPVDFFALDSYRKEPDGNTSESTQGKWLREALSDSSAPWQIVYFHHAPYNSSKKYKRSTKYMKWPFREWGAEVVLSGHAHVYERLTVDGITYIVNGLGGAGIHRFARPLPESLVRFNDDHGALLVTVSRNTALFEFYSIAEGGTLIDSFSLRSHQ